MMLSVDLMTGCWIISVRMHSFSSDYFCCPIFIFYGWSIHSSISLKIFFFFRRRLGSRHWRWNHRRNEFVCIFRRGFWFVVPLLYCIFCANLRISCCNSVKAIEILKINKVCFTDSLLRLKWTENRLSERWKRWRGGDVVAPWVFGRVLLCRVGYYISSWKIVKLEKNIQKHWMNC